VSSGWTPQIQKSEFSSELIAFIEFSSLLNSSWNGRTTEKLGYLSDTLAFDQDIFEIGLNEVPLEKSRR